MIASIGTYLPVWEEGRTRRPGDDEDAVTMAVAAGLQALEGWPGRVTRVVLVTRHLPLLDGGNGAALLAGLGLPADTEVSEQLGGAPAVLQSVADAPAETLVVAADLAPGGAGAVLVADGGPALRLSGRRTRSLPVVARDEQGRTNDYGDPRLLREQGVKKSLAALDDHRPCAAVAGLARREAEQLTGGPLPDLPTTGASAAVFALAAAAGSGGRVLAVEQATVASADLEPGPVAIHRDEPTPAPPPRTRPGEAAEIAISLAAYDRAFDAKLRLEADRCRRCGLLAYPQRYSCLGCGSHGLTETVPLPREATVYSLATVHVPVPGLATPYTVVLAELGDTGVRLLTRLTGAPPGSVTIGEPGRLVFRRVAVRHGVPDYGYAFLPTTRRELVAA